MIEDSKCEQHILVLAFKCLNSRIAGCGSENMYEIETGAHQMLSKQEARKSSIQVFVSNINFINTFMLCVNVFLNNLIDKDVRSIWFLLDVLNT